MLITGINNGISWACSMSTVLDSVGKLRHLHVLFTIKQVAKTSVIMCTNSCIILRYTLLCYKCLNLQSATSCVGARGLVAAAKYVGHCASQTVR